MFRAQPRKTAVSHCPMSNHHEIVKPHRNEQSWTTVLFFLQCRRCSCYLRPCRASPMMTQCRRGLYFNLIIDMAGEWKYCSSGQWFSMMTEGDALHDYWRAVGTRLSIMTKHDYGACAFHYFLRDRVYRNGDEFCVTIISSTCAHCVPVY